MSIPVPFVKSIIAQKRALSYSYVTSGIYKANECLQAGVNGKKILLILVSGVRLSAGALKSP